MTKEKVKWTIKRFSYIIKTLKSGKTEAYFYIGKRREKISVDEEVKQIIKIIDEIIDLEENEWLKEFFIKMRRGDKDISIILESPVERSKYYQTKERFINKIYQCCIFKGLVSYEEIISEDIG